jgi:two-component system response regulator MprA
MSIRLVKLRLDSTGAYAVFTETRGSQALATARKCRPDLILLDILMPDMAGSEVAAAIHEDPALSHIKVVYLTSMLGVGEEQQSGADAVIGKPASTEELVAAIEQALA